MEGAMRAKLGACKWALLLVGELALGSPLAAQTLRGRVIEAGGSEGLGGVSLQLVGADGAVAATGISGDDGSFTLRAPAGEYVVRLDRLGYAAAAPVPVALIQGVAAEVTLEMTVAAIPLDTLSVRTDAPRVPYLDAAGFYDRQTLGYGR